MKNKIEFYSVVEGVKEAFPVIPVHELKMPWVASAKEEYFKKRTNYKLGAGQHTGSHMCSGIVELMRTGWVITAWHDFSITTNGDNVSYQWTAPAEGLATLHDEFDPVTSFPPSFFADYVDLPANTLKSVIKFHTPWRFHMPKGWALLCMPISYMNETRFTSAIGIVDPVKANELHAILYWHKLNSTEFIKAGTPLFQVIPVRIDNPLEFELRDMNDKDTLWRKMFNNLKMMSWTANTNAKAEAYKKLFHKE